MKDLIHLAERKAVPGIIALAGPSGSGKTFSALLLAAGLCREGKRVGLIDTEKGRGEHYADNHVIKAHYPKGYDALQLDEPYSPARYYEALAAFEGKNIYDVIIIDSATHEWEGFGGCADIAENNKLGGTANWAMAKKEHKRFMRKALTMAPTVIFCIRAQEKTAVNKVGGKMVFTDLGMQPVQEKNFKFEMLIACMLDPYTKFPVVDSDFHKVPDDLRELFQAGRYVTREDGAKLRKWIDGGKVVDTALRSLEGDFRVASNNGLEGLQKFWKTLTPAQQKLLEPIKEDCKIIAAEADRQAKETSDEEPAERRGVQKSLIKPTEEKDEKTPGPITAGEAKSAPEKDTKPAPGGGKVTPIGNRGSGEQQELAAKSTAKPFPAKPPVQAQSKPAPIASAPKKEPEKEAMPEEDDIPPIEMDEAQQNAMAIADALTEEEEADAPVVQEDEEIELL